MKGRKRHTASDTGGQILMGVDVQDAADAEPILPTWRKRWP